MFVAQNILMLMVSMVLVAYAFKNLADATDVAELAQTKGATYASFVFCFRIAVAGLIFVALWSTWS